MPPSKDPISGPIRRLLIRDVDRHGLREMARETEIDPTSLSRFVEGGNLRSDILDRIAVYYNIRLIHRDQ